MTTNSFGGALPKLDFPTIQPVVKKASRLQGLPVTARIVAVTAAAGLAYYASSQVQQGSQESLQRPLTANTFANLRDAQSARGRVSDTIRLRKD